MDKVPDVISERNITPPIGHEDDLTSLLNDFAYLVQLLDRTRAHMQVFLERLKVRIEAEYSHLTYQEQARILSAARQYHRRRRDLLYANVLGHRLALFSTPAIAEFVRRLESN